MEVSICRIIWQSNFDLLWSVFIIARADLFVTTEGRAL